MTPLKAVIGSFMIVVLLLAGTAVIDTMADDEAGITETVTRDGVLLSGAGAWVDVNDGKGTDETVFKTTGFAVNLTGSDDSFVESKSSVDIASDGNWTVSVWARADAEASSANMTAVSLNGRVLIWWNGSSGNWSAWYFDEGSRDSFRVNVSDNGEQPGNFTNIIVTANESTLAIYRNNTLGGTANVTGDSIEDAPVNATNWNGRIEELRTFDKDLNDSKRQELVDSPVEQQPDISPTTRAMFDQPDKDDQLLLYTDTFLRVSNATYSAGFAEQIMDGPSPGNDILMQTDYDWDEAGPRIRPIDGRELDGAPVAYVTYEFDSALSGFVNAWAAFTDVASAIPLVAIVIAIVVTVRRIQG